MLFCSVRYAYSEPSDNRSQQILVSDLSIASQAVKTALNDKNVTALVKGLDNPLLEIKIQAASALYEIGDANAVPALLETWTSNQDVQTGGYGGRLLQRDLNQILAKTLSTLTHQPSNKSNQLTKEQMKAIVQSARQWQKTH